MGRASWLRSVFSLLLAQLYYISVTVQAGVNFIPKNGYARRPAAVVGINSNLHIYYEKWNHRPASPPRKGKLTWGHVICEAGLWPCQETDDFPEATATVAAGGDGLIGESSKIGSLHHMVKNPHDDTYVFVASGENKFSLRRTFLATTRDGRHVLRYSPFRRDFAAPSLFEYVGANGEPDLYLAYLGLGLFNGCDVVVMKAFTGGSRSTAFTSKSDNCLFPQFFFLGNNAILLISKMTDGLNFQPHYYVGQMEDVGNGELRFIAAERPTSGRLFNVATDSRYFTVGRWNKDTVAIGTSHPDQLTPLHFLSIGDDSVLQQKPHLPDQSCNPTQSLPVVEGQQDPRSAFRLQLAEEFCSKHLVANGDGKQRLGAQSFTFALRPAWNTSSCQSGRWNVVLMEVKSRKVPPISITGSFFNRSRTSKARSWYTLSMNHGKSQYIELFGHLNGDIRIVLSKSAVNVYAEGGRVVGTFRRPLRNVKDRLCYIEMRVSRKVTLTEASITDLVICNAAASI